MGESNHTRGSRTEVFAVPSREPTGLPLTVSLPCVSFLNKKHLIFTALPSLLAFRIQYFCSPCCYSRMPMVLHMACNQQGYPVLIGKQHWVFAFVGHDCFVNHSSNLDNPSSFINGLNVLKSPFFIRLFKSFWALLIHDISAFFNSSGMRGPSRLVSVFLLGHIFSANCLIYMVTRISFYQLEEFFTSVTFPTSVGETAETTLMWRRSISPSCCSVAVWTGHCSSGSVRNSGLFIHLPISCFTCNPRETSSVKFFSLGMCFRLLGSKLFWISPICTETNSLNCRKDFESRQI